MDRHVVNKHCPICEKVVYADEGYYSINMAHYDCQFPAGQKSVQETLDAIDEKLSKLGIKATRKPIGQGVSSQKLIRILEESAKSHFETGSISDIQLYLPSPVWRQYRFDVMRVEGSMMVDGRKITFGSWSSVSDLVKYRRVKFESDHPGFYVLPDIETRRTRNSGNEIESI